MSNVIGCTLFGGVAGSPLADVSAMGSVMIPLMKKEGYDADYAVNVTTHAALVGALMPTSHNLIIFALATTGIASVSVFSLILAGVIPALLLTLCNLAAAYYVAVKRGYPTRGKFPGWQAKCSRAFGGSLPGLLIVGDHPGGILSGVFTATESAATAVLWALFVTVRGLPLAVLAAFPEGLRQGLQDHRRRAAADRHLVRLRLLHGAVRSAAEDRRADDSVLGDALGHLPDDQRAAVRARHLPGHGRHHPDLHADLPADRAQFGMDPVQFGIVMLINCALGLNTPPVGVTQFVGCAIGQRQVVGMQGHELRRQLGVFEFTAHREREGDTANHPHLHRTALQVGQPAWRLGGARQAEQRHALVAVGQREVAERQPLRRVRGRGHQVQLALRDVRDLPRPGPARPLQALAAGLGHQLQQLHVQPLRVAGGILELKRRVVAPADAQRGLVVAPSHSSRQGQWQQEGMATAQAHRPTLAQRHLPGSP
jgi:hypothetical protein